MISENRIIAYSDGGADYNPGLAGWAFYVPEYIKCYGYAPEATNNEMELKAMIQLLKYIGKDQLATIYCDSTYVVKGLTQWSKGWRKHNWIKGDGNPVANPELWKELVELYNEDVHTIEFVKGHSGVLGNEICDELVQLAKADKKEFVTITLNPEKQLNDEDPSALIDKFKSLSANFDELTDYDKRIVASELLTELSKLQYKINKIL